MSGPSSTLVTYLGAMTHTARLALTPNIAAGTVGLAWETDTKTLWAYDLVNNAWTAAGSAGPSAGTPPTIVQFATNNSGSNSVTMGAAPTNGNLLVAITFNLNADSPASGWTQLGNDTSGLDYGTAFMRVAGASEPTTQTPLSSSGSAGCMIVYELHGQAASPYVTFTSSGGEQFSQAGSTPSLPSLTNCIFLGGIGIDSSTPASISAVLGCTADYHDTSGANRRGSYGHSTLATQAIGVIFSTLSVATHWKSVGVLITS